MSEPGEENHEEHQGFSDNCKHKRASVPSPFTSGRSIDSRFQASSEPSGFTFGSSNPRREMFQGKPATVRVKSANLNGRDEIETISIHEAICRTCYASLIQQNINVLKTICRCKSTLIHERCARVQANKNCNVCEQVTKYIPVTLSTEM